MVNTGRVRSCVRPFHAVLMTAGPDGIRGSGSNQTLALVALELLRSIPTPGSTGMRHIISFSPLQFLQLQNRLIPLPTSA